MRLAHFALLAAVVGAPTIAASTLAAHPEPKNGGQLLRLMHDHYAGKWYRTLTFTQKTTIHAADGTTRVETWYEAMAHTARGVQLRIDRGDPALGNGTLYTVDSTWVMRDGRLAAAREGGNEFLPIIEGVYVQPVLNTVLEMSPMRIDMAKLRSTRANGRPVWVLGAAAGDTISPQLWVDQERFVAVRMILAGADGRPGMDVALGGYVPLGGGWLATTIDIRAGGRLVQREEYSGWKADVPLDDALFAPATWTTARHWVTR